MFKKLKQKISEEQAPPWGAEGRATPLPPQVPSKSPPPNVNRSRISSFTDHNDEDTLTPDKEGWLLPFCACLYSSNCGVQPR